MERETGAYQPELIVVDTGDPEIAAALVQDEPRGLKHKHSLGKSATGGRLVLVPRQVIEKSQEE